jgi:hypothetical protein
MVDFQIWEVKKTTVVELVVMRPKQSISFRFNVDEDVTSEAQ